MEKREKTGREEREYIHTNRQERQNARREAAENMAPFCDLLLANSSLKTPLNLLCTQLHSEKISFMGWPPDNVTPTLYIRRCAVKSGSVVAPSYILGITRDHKFTVP